MRITAAMLAMCLVGGTAGWALAEQSDEVAIRGGRTVANTICVACHIVSPRQTIKPLYTEPLPSFEEIANRPGTTAESLHAFIDNAHWKDYALPRRPMPMAMLSDRDKARVIAFILSLKKEEGHARGS